jgi:phage shock protein E
VIGRAPGLASAAALALALAGCTASEANTADGPPAEAAQGIAALDVTQFAALVEAGKAVLIDVRTPEEFAEGHIAGAVNMPLDGFDPAAVPQVPGKQTVLHCRSGKRSLAAAQQLASATGGATHLAGGIVAWRAAGRKVTAAQ